MYYSAIGLIAIGVLIIVNQDILRNHKESYERPVWKVYRRFLIAVLAYYITDVLWGILDSNKLSKLLFIDTTVYFVAMSIGILLWAVFTVEYLEEKLSLKPKCQNGQYQIDLKHPTLRSGHSLKRLHEFYFLGRRDEVINQPFPSFGCCKSKYYRAQS